MATVKLDPNYQELANSLATEFKARGIKLTDYAEGLLRLSVESWFEDPPRLKLKVPSAKEELDRLAREILKRTFEEPHIAGKSRNGKVVHFHELLYALSQSGWDVVKDVLDKGY